jgi:lipopolysaccharide export LptBFGC system permease protein LptF
MAFVATVAFCTTLGETGALPPLLAVWAPSLAFMLLSLYTFLGVET